MTNRQPPAVIAPSLSPDDDQRSRRGQITGLLREWAILIVHEGLHYDEAAKRVGMTVRNARKALRKPFVLKFLKEERRYLLHAIRSETPRRLKQLRDQDENRAAAVRAADLIEHLDEAAERTSAPRMPGIVIQIVAAPAEKVLPRPTPGVVIEHKPSATVPHTEADEPESQSKTEADDE
jgi:hypothetical protein